MAAGGLGVYLMVSLLSALVFNRQTVSPYWIANHFQWMPVATLLFHLTFPWRWAVRLSLTMLGLVALAVAVGTYPIVRRLTKRLELVQQA